MNVDHNSETFGKRLGHHRIQRLHTLTLLPGAGAREDHRVDAQTNVIESKLTDERDVVEGSVG
jgi:hypothetical protein